RIAREGCAVIVVLHDLALAAQWADRIIVLENGVLHSTGTPAEVLTPEMLAKVYRVSARVEACSKGRLQIHVDGAL
ncbi:MAG TPA: ABC transporter ATP-binding protein, partial [Paenirhodobacter sp.]